MTDLVTDQSFRTLGPSDAIPNDFVVPYYLDDLKRHARSPEACSQGRRSCASATAPGSTSPPAL
jgi:hypothetical protein